MAVKKDRSRADEDDADTDIDHGYAWVILAGCFVMYGLVIGTVKAYGILYTEMVSYYGTGSGNTAWIGSMTLLLLLGLSPVANSLSRKFTFRRVAFTGGLLLCLGYFVSGFVPRMEVMYLTMGLCAGLGYGLSFSPCSTIISYYFKKHRALANGIVVSGSGIGALTYPSMYSFLIEKYGLSGAFWIIGGFLLNVCVAACLFRQPKLLLQEKKLNAPRNHGKDHEVLLKKNNQGGEEKSKDTLINCYGLDFRFSLFKNPRFTMYCVGFVLCMNGYGNNLIMIPAYIKDVGHDTSHAVYGVTVMGGCEMVARIGFGLIADRKLMKRKHIFLVSMFIAAVFSFIAPLFDSFIFLAIYAGVIGTFPGSFWSLVAVLIIDVVGMEDFAQAFGLVMLCLASGVAISQPAVGWLKDYTGNWHASLILNGFLFLFSGLLILLEQYILRVCKKQETPPVGITIIQEIPLQNNQLITSQDDTDSLLDENGEIFTSTKISRTYTPYDTEIRQTYQQNSHVPTADTKYV